MKLPLKPTFFSVFLSCLERLVLTYFEIIYLWISWPKSYMKRYEGGIFRKAPDWKRFFFSLKIKIKQNLGCPNKEYNAIFKHIHQNIKAYSRSKKKNLHWSMTGKLLNIGKNLSEANHWRTSLGCSKYSRWGCGKSQP